jgi:hypothetical protein
MPTTTPWGVAQYTTNYGTGINSYSTAGHGGIKVSDKLNKQIPIEFRNADGWYEEDCESNIVHYFFYEQIAKAERANHGTSKSAFGKDYTLADLEVHQLTYNKEWHKMQMLRWFPCAYILYFKVDLDKLTDEEVFGTWYTSYGTYKHGSEEANNPNNRAALCAETRANLKERVANLSAKLDWHKDAIREGMPKAGDIIEFKEPIKFTDGTQMTRFYYEGASRFKMFEGAYGGYNIRQWRKREFKIVAADLLQAA